ncbi:hypothetical protein GCM10011351_09810 [Paraliobacillus quinghaiensis]|uniref:Uncharacterized protein n=1 Tax=Paraliobacillus quinghaiensis TaxID=470815 RepID=A0A917TK43_9BACI|nr:hypothetical protein [Paraliobacillus quinghaiensis]GGM26212.1 hypothetical protein GCM10011351_09810 [Paraliobacillus quinghaiensis]
MNTTGFIRGYMAKNQEGEKYLYHVVRVVEQQLQELDENYKVELMKSEGCYTISIQGNKPTLEVIISNSNLLELQSRSPYSLDRYIWTDLKKKGVDFKEATGNYLEYVFI